MFSPIVDSELKENVIDIECPALNCETWFEGVSAKMAKTLEKVSVVTNFTYNNVTNETMVSVKIVAKEDLENFKYYQKIPKCMAIYAHLIKFKNTNYKILKDDPLVVWHFAKVSKGEELDLSFDVSGNIPEECRALLADLLYEEDKFSTVNLISLIAGLILLAVIGMIVVSSQKKQNDLLDEAVRK